jgi:hypothetical protein
MFSRPGRNRAALGSVQRIRPGPPKPGLGRPGLAGPLPAQARQARRGSSLTPVGRAEMAMRTRLAGALSRGLLATAIVGVTAVVAACGSVRAGPGSHPGTAAGSRSASAGSASPSAGSAAAAAVPLCTDAAHLDRMVVSLGSGFMPGHVREAQPVGVTIADPARVRAVAAALCRLPVKAPTHMLCPDIHAGVYRLTFFAAGRMFPPITVVAAGCRRPVYGLGPARVASGSFLGLLRSELGPGHGIATPVPMAA